MRSGQHPARLLLTSTLPADSMPLREPAGGDLQHTSSTSGAAPAFQPSKAEGKSALQQWEEMEASLRARSSIGTSVAATDELSPPSSAQHQHNASLPSTDDGASTLPDLGPSTHSSSAVSAARMPGTSYPAHR